jgi:hypothetical protein
MAQDGTQRWASCEHIMHLTGSIKMRNSFTYRKIKFTLPPSSFVETRYFVEYFVNRKCK